MLFQLWVICLGPVCVPIWGLLPILFTLFPSLRKYIVGERSPQWLRTCLCLKKEGSTTPKLNRKPLDKDRLQELDEMMAAQATNLVIQSPSEYDHVLNTLIRTHQRNVVVQWTASWCKPCKEMQPVVTQLSNSIKSRVTFLKCDLDVLPSLSQECHITAVPTFQGFGRNKNENVDLEGEEATLLFTIVGKKEKELLSEVANLVEIQLRGNKTSRFDIDGAKAHKGTAQGKEATATTATAAAAGAAAPTWEKEKLRLLIHHTKVTATSGWKITKLLSAFPISPNFSPEISPKDGGVGGVKLEVVLCSGDVCQKKIYKVMNNGKVL
jgi:thioredoxin 1